MAILNKVQESQLYKNIKSSDRNDAISKIDDYTTNKNFITSTYQELRKVIWPSPWHVAKWSLITIIFCIVVGGVLGYTDRFFSSSVLYGDCIVKVRKNQTSNNISDCTGNYLNTLVLRK